MMMMIDDADHALGCQSAIAWGESDCERTLHTRYRLYFILFYFNKDLNFKTFKFKTFKKDTDFTNHRFWR